MQAGPDVHLLADVDLLGDLEAARRLEPERVFELVGEMATRRLPRDSVSVSDLNCTLAAAVDFSLWGAGVPLAGWSSRGRPIEERLMLASPGDRLDFCLGLRPPPRS